MKFKDTEEQNNPTDNIEEVKLNKNENQEDIQLEGGMDDGNDGMNFNQRE